MKQYQVKILIAGALFLWVPMQLAAIWDQRLMFSESEQICDFSKFKPLRISSETERIKQASKPEYPEDAKRKGIEGRVVVKVLIDPDGIVRKACAISGDRMLRKAAVKAALDTIFHPVLLNGMKFTQFLEEQVIFEFKLTNK